MSSHVATVEDKRSPNDVITSVLFRLLPVSDPELVIIPPVRVSRVQLINGSKLQLYSSHLHNKVTVG